MNKKIFSLSIVGRGGGGGSDKYLVPTGTEILGGWGPKAKVPSAEGGRGMDIFWNYTMHLVITHTLKILNK